MSSVTNSNNHYRNILTMAIQSGDIAITKYMLTIGLTFNETDIINAAANGHINLVKFILEHIPKQELGTRVVYDSIAENNIQLLKGLVHAGVDVTDDDYIITAVRWGHIAIVEYLIDQGANIHARHNKCMTLACRYNNRKMVELLISRGIDVSDYSYKALDIACEYGHLELVKYLMPQESWINNRNFHVMKTASRHGHIEIVNYLGKLVIADIDSDVYAKFIKNISMNLSEATK